MNGDDFAAAHLGDDEGTFEKAVVQAVTDGEFVEWALCDVPMGDRFVLRVECDYFAMGATTTPFRVPLSAPTAQKVADILAMLLPWRKLVDATWRAAMVQLVPLTGAPLGIKIGTLDQMSVRAFLLHNDAVQRQLDDQAFNEEDGSPFDKGAGHLLAGHKKDVVLTNRLLAQPHQVSIYGWHLQDGKPIQPLSLVHEAAYRDYSHGVRLVSHTMLVDGQEAQVLDVLKDPVLGLLLADELDPSTQKPAPLTVTRYPGT